MMEMQTKEYWVQCYKEMEARLKKCTHERDEAQTAKKTAKELLKRILDDDVLSPGRVKDICKFLLEDKL